MRICKECKHRWLDHGKVICAAPQNEISLIHGGVIVQYAKNNRDKEHLCGQEGKWFVKRTPNWELFLDMLRFWK